MGGVDAHKKAINFNPRAREGRDTYGDYCFYISISISIHAPVKGATRNSLILVDTSFDFNPRAREGRDLTAQDTSRQKALFQSTRP